MSKSASDVFFASAKPGRIDRDLTLPAKFMRLLDKLPIKDRVKGKTVAIKMHLGGGLGYSTIHPLFTKLMVDHVKAGNPHRVFITDGSVEHAGDRGYALDTVGAELVPAIGPDGKDVKEIATGWPRMKSVLIGNPIVDADVLINFSHVKGHGDCGFGAACKNLAMGCVPPSTRGAMHSLEGKLTWERTKCIHCKKCIEECAMKANSFTKEGDYSIFWHHCKMCMHCMLACPTKAIFIKQPKFDLFQEALARTTRVVLNTFEPENVFHVSMLTHITIYCDCWGFTTPALVPDIGALASTDIVAIDRAALDLIRTEDLIPGSITPPYVLLKKGRHLFEKIHGKNPYIQVDAMEKLKLGTSEYRKVDVK